ncbi:hypothetical protein CRM22_007326 [Opisthorchis felineus]|uniref:Uncharacterized protein n=1 Tax=Opisthorchis felineus TaxID=147828 RepID=A0A4S2LPT0_OPIFE|nr:hypothetical protein CRM22_007326 [Opisthorchis felineus]
MVMGIISSELGLQNSNPVRTLKCYVCTDCPAVLKEGPDVQIKDNCSACVIEEKFQSTKYLRTDRSCGPCPSDLIRVINDSRFVDQCCHSELCLGISTNFTVRLTQAENTTVAFAKAASSETAVVTEDPSVSSSETEGQYLKPSTETETQELESQFAAAKHTCLFDPELSLLLI